MGVVFLAGIYGVGKSSYASTLISHDDCKHYNASELISKVTHEAYGSNKNVTDKHMNQIVLIQEVEKLLKHENRIVLCGHFVILNREMECEYIPEETYSQLHIEEVVLLKRQITSIQRDLILRDAIDYPLQLLMQLDYLEENQARKISYNLNVPLKIVSLDKSEV